MVDALTSIGFLLGGIGALDRWCHGTALLG